MNISVENNLSADEEKFIKDELAQFNKQFCEDENHLPLNIVIRNPKNNKIIAGLLGGTYWRWLYIDTLWINENYRNQRLGSRILKIAEQEAIKRGCKFSHLYTHEFQAPDFYEKQNYKIHSTIKDLPIGHNKILLIKEL